MQQDTGKASSRQKKPSSVKNFFTFSVFCESFFAFWIRIQPTKIIADPDLAPDPDPQH
jgi:hypothetical protein